MLTNPTSVQPLLLKPRDAAKMLAVCERTIWALAKRGELRPVRIGKAVRYSVDDLQDFIERQIEHRQEGGTNDPY